jgi:hypothetical protein
LELTKVRHLAMHLGNCLERRWGLMMAHQMETYLEKHLEKRLDLMMEH